MMVDYRPPAQFGATHRKPVPAPNSFRADSLRPLTQIHPDGYSNTATNASPGPTTTTTTTTTFSSPFPPRTTSTTATNTTHHSQPITSSPVSQPYNNPLFTSRRTPSQSTTSTTNFAPSRTPSNVSSKISRTSSTKSIPTPSSYVALMRKQKATVWCDRAQPEDPRLLQQQKAAKVRASRELSGLARGTISSDARSSTGGSMGSGSLGVRSKIRHHGVPKAQGVGFGRGNLMGGQGVPMRLSANEVGDEGTYMPSAGPPVPHKRNSSLQSRDSRFLAVDTTANGRRLSSSSGLTPNSAQAGEDGKIPEAEEALGAGNPGARGSDYYEGKKSLSGNSAGGRSSNNSERENSFGGLGAMSGPSSTGVVGSRERSGSYGKGNTAEDLKRRGSVDERGLFPQGTGRLVIANPDLSDSD